MSTLKNLSMATAGVAFVVLGTVSVAQAGSISLTGRVIFENSETPVSAANTTTSFFIGGTQFPPTSPPITFNDTTDTNGDFSAFTIVSPNIYFSGGSPSATVLIAPTASSETFLAQEFTVPSTSFSVDRIEPGGYNFVSTETFRVKSVPEPLTILGSALALGFGVLTERQYSRKRKKTKQIG